MKSIPKRSESDYAITAAIVEAMEKLGAHPYLLGVVASWGKTLSDPEVLGLLKALNKANVPSQPSPRPKPGTRFAVVQGGRSSRSAPPGC